MNVCEMPLSEADEWRLADSITFEKSARVAGAKSEWKAVSGASKLTLNNFGLGWKVEIPRATIDEFGLDEVLATVEALRIKVLIERLELNNSVSI